MEGVNFTCMVCGHDYECDRHVYRCVNSPLFTDHVYYVEFDFGGMEDGIRTRYSEYLEGYDDVEITIMGW